MARTCPKAACMPTRLSRVGELASTRLGYADFGVGRASVDLPQALVPLLLELQADLKLSHALPRVVPNLAGHQLLAEAVPLALLYVC